MDREIVIATLRAHEAELKSAGVLHLSLFGSVARGEASPDSDVDLMVEFDEGRRLTLIGAIGIENQIADVLGVSVDLAQRGKHKPTGAGESRARGRAGLLTIRSSLFKTSVAFMRASASLTAV